jgi:hypothetical protein
VITVDLMALTFLDPIISIRLQDVYGIGPQYVGYIYLMGIGAFLIGLPIYLYLLERMERRVITFYGLCLSTIGLYLVGPS